MYVNPQNDNVEPLIELLPEVGEYSNEILGECNSLNSSHSDDSEEIEESEPASQLEITEHNLPPSNVLLKQFVVRHHLTQDALSDLLKFLSIYSTTDKWPSSVYLFDKQFKAVQNAPIFHYFCNDCFHSLPSANEKKCPNDLCGNQLNIKGAISSFIELPLQPQFTSLLQRTYVCNSYLLA